MLTLIKQAKVYAPEELGQRDILCAGGKILAIETEIKLDTSVPCQQVEAAGRLAIPGMVDSLVHFTGGGGEGGPHTRTPELRLSQAIEAGVTTLIGALGTDSESRSLAELVAKARALNHEGVSAYCHTGSYQIPVKTLTGSVERDLLLVDIMLGVGEVAVADHRSSQPTLDELKKVVAAARVGGMLAGKAGTVLVHMGDAPDQLDLLEALFASTDIPRRQLQVTHVNRSRSLFETAIGYAKRGGFVDFTTSTTPELLKWGEVECGEGLREMLAAGVPLSQISFSSDGQASLPVFDGEGNLVGLQVGQLASLWQAVQDALAAGVPLAQALAVVTANPARLLGLKQKGRLQAAMDADLLLVQPDSWRIDSVMAKGRWLKLDGQELAKGTFE
ncbi:beta-aspartyl-peptidase [Balneatrix alpica]|uniref:Isoaspartyl dipeptidase n=1 Tax=Balneatrix alpica TaxID=75684 RepID=A0ABV5Z9H7_9GAMM|nr:beta-aspartyl-peptidase [Balneatrix alpica]